MIELNAKNITDEIMALSALRAMTGNGAADGHPRLLTRDHLPGLRAVMRMVFAETLVHLGAYVEECAIGTDESAEPSASYSEEAPMQLRIRPAYRQDMPPGMAEAVKRHFEHIVAAGTIGWVATGGDAELAAQVQGTRESALDALRGLFGESNAPFRTTGQHI